MFIIGPNITKINPKNIEKQANWPKNIQKVHKLLQKIYWLMWLESVQNRPKNDQNQPKNVENQANWPKNIQKVHKLLQNSYSGQKPWDFPLKPYCWSPNLLGSSCPTADTICTSGAIWYSLCNFDTSLLHFLCQLQQTLNLCHMLTDCVMGTNRTLMIDT